MKIAMNIDDEIREPTPIGIEEALAGFTDPDVREALRSLIRKGLIVCRMRDGQLEMQATTKH